MRNSLNNSLLCDGSSAHTCANTFLKKHHNHWKWILKGFHSEIMLSSFDKFLYLLKRTWHRLKVCLKAILYGCEIVLGIFFGAGLGFFFGCLGWYHLPSVCNGLELEFVILHGICHIWACSPSILHGIYYMWACSPSILYGICHILACSPSILHGISYMWACSPSILYGICHILACSPSILHGMFYMWACSPKYLQMRKLGIR